MKQRSRDGLTQPYPDSVSIEFYAFGRRFSLNDMQLQTAAVTQGSEITLENAEAGTRTVMPNQLSTYYFKDESAGIEATATLQTDGVFYACFN